MRRPLFFSFCLPDLFSSLAIVFPHSSPRTAFLVHPVRHGQTVRVSNYIYSLNHPPTSSYQQPFSSGSRSCLPSNARPPSAQIPIAPLSQQARLQPLRTSPAPPLASRQPPLRLASSPTACRPRASATPARRVRGRDSARVAAPQTLQARALAPAPASVSLSRRSALGASLSVIDRITLLTCHHRSLACPFPVCVPAVQHYSHGPYPQSFYPYPYHQNMPHRVEDMSIDRSIRFAPPSHPIRTPVTHILTSHSHRSDGPAQYQFMPPHSHPTPPPIATLHHSPALSASSLESNSISPSPPVRLRSLPVPRSHPLTLLYHQVTQPSTPYYPHPAQAPPMSQAPPYPYQPNGAMPRYAEEQPAQGYAVPPHSAQSISRSIRPTMVATQPYPGQANYIIHTDDASTKLSDRVRRKCYNCRTTDTSTWRRSSLTPGKVVSARPPRSSLLSSPSPSSHFLSRTHLLTRSATAPTVVQQVWPLRAHALAPAP